MDCVAVRIGEDLDFDVPRAPQILFYQHAVIAKGRACLPLGTGERGVELDRAPDDPHPAPAAAGGGFDQDRKPDPLGLIGEAGGLLIFAVITRDERHPVPLHQRFRRRFGPHGPHSRRGRADEHDPCRLAGLGEIGILRQKAVTWMHRLGAAVAGHTEDRLDL